MDAYSLCALPMLWGLRGTVHKGVGLAVIEVYFFTCLRRIGLPFSVFHNLCSMTSLQGSFLAMMLYWGLLSDLAIFSMRISAYAPGMHLLLMWAGGN